MLLAIDCGNTNIVFTLFEAQTKLSEWRLETVSRQPTDEYFIALCHVLESQKLHYTDIKNCILASVVPVVTHHLVRFCEERLAVTPMVVGEEGVKLNLNVQTDDPTQVGADRLVNAVAVAAAGDVPAIILDFGTATTLDLIGQKGAYEGGIIAPGVNLSIEALHMAAARLPRIAVKPWKTDMPVLGTDTISAMQSGVFWGYVGLIEGLLERLRNSYGADLPAIATGGLAPLFANHINGPLIVDVDLTLKGLVRIHAQNKI